MIDNINFASPLDMAAHLAGYMNCPSKVQTHVNNHFGRAKLTREQAEKAIQRVKDEEAKRKRISEHRNSDSEESDGLDYDVRRLKRGRKQSKAVEFVSYKNTADPWPSWYRPRGILPADMLIRSVANEFGISADTVKAKERPIHHVHARSVIVKILRERNLSKPMIGKLLGGRDHSTVWNSLVNFDMYERINPLVSIVYNKFRGKV